MTRGCEWVDNQCDFINETQYNNKRVLFDNDSNPNTRTHDNLNSYFSFEIIDVIGDEMKIRATYDHNDLYEVEYIDDDVYHIGNSPDENCIFYNRTEHPIIKVCIDDLSNMYTLSEHDFFKKDIPDELSTGNSRLLVKDNKYFLVRNAGYYILDDEIINHDDTPIFPIGYYSSLTEEEEVEDALSLGDVDQDGYDEKFIIDDNNTLHCYNSNNTFCPGFPVYGNYKDIPLIVDIIDNPGPEIIVRNGNFISIISNSGENLLDIPSYANESDLQIIPNWGNANTACLVNGNRLFIFDEFNEDNSYWYNFYSTSYNYPEVAIQGPRENQNDIYNIGIDLNRTYSYPNPIEKGFTKFRFFVYNANKVTVKIYDTLGVLVSKLESNSLIHNEYNEIYWNASNFNSGLYFAEIQSDMKESKLIKVVILR